MPAALSFLTRVHTSGLEPSFNCARASSSRLRPRSASAERQSVRPKRGRKAAASRDASSACYATRAQMSETVSDTSPPLALSSPSSCTQVLRQARAYGRYKYAHARARTRTHAHVRKCTQAHAGVRRGTEAHAPQSAQPDTARTLDSPFPPDLFLSPSIQHTSTLFLSTLPPP
eukprot:6191013-Pleurochrysis_carterae.AAC.3